MNKKALFFDIDGTLVESGGIMSSRVLEAIHKARANGHKVFICTGRNKAGISSLLDVGFDGYICSAGGYIEIDNQVIYVKHLDEKEVMRVRNIYERNHLIYNMEATHHTYSHKDIAKIFVEGSKKAKGKSNSELQRLIELERQKFNMKDLQEYDKEKSPIHKLCFIGFNQEDVNNAVNELKDEYNVVIHSLFESETINGEIIKKGIDKGRAIIRVCEYLRIPIEDTIGFGDSMNDYEMIVTCNKGIVMGNGTKELKKYADIICESVEEDGIYHELKRQHII